MHNTFRPKSNLAWGALAYLLLAIYLIQSIFYPGTNENAVLNIGIVIVVGAAVYLIWVRPRIIFKEETLTVVNPFSTKTIKYKEITGLSTHWTLTIETSSENVKAWVAPANTRRQGLSKSALKFKGVQAGTERPNISDSELAARLIQNRIDGVH